MRTSPSRGAPLAGVAARAGRRRGSQREGCSARCAGCRRLPPPFGPRQCGSSRHSHATCDRLIVSDVERSHFLLYILLPCVCDSVSRLGLPHTMQAPLFLPQAFLWHSHSPQDMRVANVFYAGHHRC